MRIFIFTLFKFVKMMKLVSVIEIYTECNFFLSVWCFLPLTSHFTNVYLKGHNPKWTFSYGNLLE